MLEEVGTTERGSAGRGYCSWALLLAPSLERRSVSKADSRSDDVLMNSKQGARCTVTA